MGCPHICKLTSNTQWITTYIDNLIYKTIKSCNRADNLSVSYSTPLLRLQTASGEGLATSPGKSQIVTRRKRSERYEHMRMCVEQKSTMFFFGSPLAKKKSFHLLRVHVGQVRQWPRPGKKYKEHHQNGNQMADATYEIKFNPENGGGYVG